MTALSAQASSLSAGEPFIVSTIESPTPGKQTALAGDFRGRGLADLFIVTTSRDGLHVGRLYEQRDDGTFDSSPLLETEVDHDATVVDSGRLGDRDAIIFLSPGGAIQYDPLTDTVRRIVAGVALYAAPSPADLPRIDFFRDITGDGLDDLVIPNFLGYNVLVQQQEGTFAEPVQMVAPPTMDMAFDNHPWYQPQPLFFADMNLDGRDDAVLWHDNGFNVYPMQDDGTYSANVLRRRSNIAFDLVGIDNVSSRLRDEDQSNLTLTTLYSVSDLSGDGPPELATLTLVSEGVFKKESTYSIYRGVAQEGEVSFVTPATSVIESRGIQFETSATDIDNDDDTDLVISSVRIGIGKVIGALLTGSVEFDLDFYAMEDGIFSSAPSISRQITATIDLGSGDFLYPFVLIADITGDGLKELLVQEGTDTIKVYEGLNDGSLFASRSVDVKLELPNDADLVDLTELNGDDRRDLVMRIENKNQKGRVTVLVSQP